MIASDVRMGDAREYGEVFAQIAKDFEILAGFVVLARLFGKERRPI